MENYVLKILEIEDLEKVMEIEKKSFSKNICENIEVYKERILFFSQGNYGIWKNEKMIGFISSELWNFENIYDEKRFFLSHSIKQYHFNEGKELYISSFAIDKDYQGNGLGKKVFNNFLKIMKENFFLESSILLVSTEWKNAKKIYLNYNFNVINEFQDFFTNDFNKKFNGIIMRKFF